MAYLRKTTRPILSAIPAYALLVTIPERARADAFFEKPGEGKIIFLSTFDRADRYWTRDGRLIPIAAYNKFALSALAEYGVDANTTMIGRAEIGRLDDFAGVEAQGAGAIGVRRLVFDGGALRVAAQAMVSAGPGLEGMPFRSSGAALDVRLTAARTFSIAKRSAFVAISAGPRVVTGDGRGLRLDVTFGLKPAEKWLLLFQNFNRFNEESPFRGRARAHKAQASVMYDLTEKWSLIGGVFTTVSARAERRQHGVLAGAQRRF